MGAECSVERNNNLTSDQDQDKNGKEGLEDINSAQMRSFNFECKSYKEYIQKIDNIQLKFKEILKKVEIKNDYSVEKFTKNTLEKIEMSYHSNIEIVRMEKLFEVALLVYQRIGSVFGNSFHFPKEELSKIDYNLISRYLAYEVDEEDDSGNITKKILKRISFFYEEYPLKLNKLEKIITSKKVVAFGYDIYNRLTFYIKPYFTQIEEKFLNPKFKDMNIRNLSYNNSIFLEKIDYIIYLFFIIEHVLPTLKDKYNFSDQINIILDFNDKDADSELIRFIMYYLNNYYPLILGKMHIVRFKFENLKKNISFRNELSDLDYFRNITFHNQTYKFQIIKDYYPNCLPIEYGGYHDLDGYQIKKDFLLDDFIEYTLSMILIKKI